MISSRFVDAERKNWKRSLIILLFCQFFAMGGMSALIPFLPLFIRELGISDTHEIAIWSGLVYGSPFVTFFLAQPVWGVVGDKSGRKLMAVRALFGLALAQVLVYFVPNVYWLLAIRLFQGTLSGFNVAAMSLITSIAPKEKNGYAISLLQSASNGGVVVGPIIGGLISEVTGFRGVFLSVGLILGVLALVVMMFVDESKSEVAVNASKQVKENLKFMRSDRILLGTTLLIMLTSLGISVLRPIFVLYVESFPLPTDFSLAFAAGALYSIIGIFSTLSSAFFGKLVDSISLKKALGFASLGTGLMYVLHPFITDLFWLIPVRTVLGLSYGIIVPVLFTKISSRSTESNRGGLLSLASSSQTLGVILGSFLSGNLVTLLGVRFPFLAVGLFFIGITSITPFLRED